MANQRILFIVGVMSLCVLYVSASPVEITEVDVEEIVNNSTATTEITTTPVSTTTEKPESKQVVFRLTCRAFCKRKSNHAWTFKCRALPTGLRRYCQICRRGNLCRRVGGGLSR